MKSQQKTIPIILLIGFFLLSLTLSTTTETISTAQALSNNENNNSLFIVNFSLGDFDIDIQTAIHEFLNSHAQEILTQERQYTITVQYEDQNHVQHIRLIPTVVYESNWTQPLKKSDIISLSINQEGTAWRIEFESQIENLNSPQQVNAPYSFPWTNGQVWAKTQGFHYNNLGYSLDFSPRNGASNNVLAIESGVFSPYCYIASDPYQAMVLITHPNGDQSGYLHLSKGSIPSSDFNQSIPKGQIIGSLYTGSAISNPNPACTDLANYKYATACGCGYATHLHFETNNPITIQGYSLSSISSAANGTLYTSNNSSGSSCCGCTTQTSTWNNFGFDSGSANNTNLSLFGLPGLENNTFTPLHPSVEIESAPTPESTLIEDFAPGWPATSAPVITTTNEPSPSHLSWPEAVDGTGEVVDYLVYWGDDSEGTAEIPTTTTSITPSEQQNPADGPTTRYLRAAARDDMGHISDWQTMTIWQYDPVLPTGTLTIGSGGDLVNTLNVRLTLSAKDEGSQITQMRFSHDGQTWTEWEPFINQKMWQLEETEQPQMIYAQVQDEAGNLSEIMTETVTAELTLLPPTSTNYTLSCRTFGMGGGNKSSAHFIVQSTTGQPYETGSMQSGSYQVNSGYWSTCGTDVNFVVKYRVFLPAVIR